VITLESAMVALLYRVVVVGPPWCCPHLGGPPLRSI
jgi:hypothetical protein